MAGMYLISSLLFSCLATGWTTHLLADKQTVEAFIGTPVTIVQSNGVAGTDTRLADIGSEAESKKAISHSHSTQADFAGVDGNNKPVPVLRKTSHRDVHTTGTHVDLVRVDPSSDPFPVIHREAASNSHEHPPQADQSSVHGTDRPFNDMQVIPDGRTDRIFDTSQADSTFNQEPGVNRGNTDSYARDPASSLQSIVSSGSVGVQDTFDQSYYPPSPGSDAYFRGSLSGLSSSLPQARGLDVGSPVRFSGPSLGPYSSASVGRTVPTGSMFPIPGPFTSQPFFGGPIPGPGMFGDRRMFGPDEEMWRMRRQRRRMSRRFRWRMRRLRRLMTRGGLPPF